jgi:two-component system, LytTR family, sensor histidine kinase AlgZ
MHPILYNRQRLILYLLAWIVMSLLLALQIAYMENIPWLNAVVFILPPGIIYAFIALSAFFLCRIFPLKTSMITQLLVLYAATGLVTSGVWSLLGYGWSWALNEIFTSSFILSINTIILLLIFGAIGYWFSVAVHYLIITFQQSQEAEKQTMELKLLAQEAELKFLRTQIDPHFLFNALNSLSALTASDPSAARRMTLILADFFRNSIALGSQAFISLKDEIELVNNFLSIEQIRFGQRLSVEFDIPDDTLAMRIPPLMLQPLVENAVKHGIAQILDGGLIRIQSRTDSTILSVIIQNPCDADSLNTKGTGLGLENIRKRLGHQYGNQGDLIIDKKKSTYTVTINIPVIP